MGRFDKKEPRLNEVKAVLQRLQGFPDEEPPAAGTKAPAAPPRRSLGGLVVAVIIFAPAVAILAALYLFLALLAPDPQEVAKKGESVQPAIRSEAVKAALESARVLMAKGQVRAAREQLLALAWKGSPDAAWDVARTYDPNALAEVPAPDANPDVAEATRWYRTWYEAAVKEGLVSKDGSKERIERIIRAMQH